MIQEKTFSHFWLYRLLPEKVVGYFELIRFEKPIGFLQFVRWDLQKPIGFLTFYRDAVQKQASGGV